jgi:hypothetical protein
MDSSSHSVALSTIFVITIILSFSNTALLISVMICCTTMATFIVSLLVKLRAYTDRPVQWITCCGRCCCTRCRTLFPSVCRACGCWCLSVLTQCSCVGLLWWDELREERFPRGSLGSSLCSSSLQLSSRMAAASVWCWVRFLSFY